MNKLQLDTSAIYVETDGTVLWLTATGEEEIFDNVSDLLNYAEEFAPQEYPSIKAWVERGESKC